MTVENGESRRSWTARTWFMAAVACWLLYGVTVALGAPGLGVVFVVLAIACVVGLAWRLLDGR